MAAIRIPCSHSKTTFRQRAFLIFPKPFFFSLVFSVGQVRGKGTIEMPPCLPIGRLKCLGFLVWRVALTFGAYVTFFYGKFGALSVLDGMRTFSGQT